MRPGEQLRTVVKMLTEEDVARLAESCRLLPEPRGDYLEDDFLVNLVATVVDFQTHTTAVERAITHFRDRVRPQLAGLDDLVELLDSWPPTREGNTALAERLWGYKMWTRAQMLRDLVAYFISVGVTTQEQLRQWANSTHFADFEGRVPGLGRAVYQWPVMRQGVDTVKPDVHVHRFLKSVLGRRLSDADAVDAVVRAAGQLGRTAVRLDWAIWEAGRLEPRAAPRPPTSSPPAPAASIPGDDRPATSFLDDDDSYLNWLQGHPDGFVLNSERRPTARYLVAHRATCSSISGDPAGRGRSWTAAYRKTCADELYTLTSWAATVGGQPTFCGRCKPPRSGSEER